MFIRRSCTEVEPSGLLLSLPCSLLSSFERTFAVAAAWEARSWSMRLLLLERTRPAGDFERGLSGLVTEMMGIGSSRLATEGVLSAMVCMSLTGRRG
jgi:hypothetical protein